MANAIRRQRNPRHGRVSKIEIFGVKTTRHEGQRHWSGALKSKVREAEKR